MQVALKAKSILRRLVVQEDGGPVATDTPDFRGLPDWVAKAYLDHKFFLDAEDGFGILWVEVPIDFGPLGVAVRASPNSLLIYDEGDGYIHVLTEVEYVGPFSARGEEEDE